MIYAKAQLAVSRASDMTPASCEYYVESEGRRLRAGTTRD